MREEIYELFLEEVGHELDEERFASFYHLTKSMMRQLQSKELQYTTL